MNVNSFLGSMPAQTVTKTSGIVSDNSNSTKSLNGKGYNEFGEMFKAAFKNLEETQQVVDNDNYQMAMGNLDNLHEAMINSEKAATALELTTQITSRAVSAYNEILRMQI